MRLCSWAILVHSVLINKKKRKKKKKCIQKWTKLTLNISRTNKNFFNIMSKTYLLLGEKNYSEKRLCFQKINKKMKNGLQSNLLIQFVRETYKNFFSSKLQQYLTPAYYDLLAFYLSARKFRVRNSRVKTTWYPTQVNVTERKWARITALFSFTFLIFRSSPKPPHCYLLMTWRDLDISYRIYPSYGNR